MVKKTTVFVDPTFFDSGDLGLLTGDTDEHFTNDIESSIRIVLDAFVSNLPEYHKSAVEMCVMSNITYEAAAETISILRGVQTDKKTVWRWARAGVEQVKEWLMQSPWVGPVTDGKIPVEYLDRIKEVSLPWEED